MTNSLKIFLSLFFLPAGAFSLAFLRAAAGLGTFGALSLFLHVLVLSIFRHKSSEKPVAGQLAHRRRAGAPVFVFIWGQSLKIQAGRRQIQPESSLRMIDSYAQTAASLSFSAEM